MLQVVIRQMMGGTVVGSPWAGIGESQTWESSPQGVEWFHTVQCINACQVTHSQADKHSPNGAV